MPPYTYLQINLQPGNQYVRSLYTALYICIYSDVYFKIRYVCWRRLKSGTMYNVYNKLQLF